MSGEKPVALQRFPSSAVTSYRSISPGGPEAERNGGLWDTLKKSVVKNTLVAVGLKPTREESRHWDAVKSIVFSHIHEGKLDEGQEPSLLIQTSHHPKDASLVRRASGRIIPTEETDGASYVPQPSFAGRHVSVPGRHLSVRPGTGRSQVLPLDPKPDLWKLAVNSIVGVSRFKRKDVSHLPAEEKSFSFADEDVELDEPDGYGGSPFSTGSRFTPIMEDDEDQFFGIEHGAPEVIAVDSGAKEETDFGLSYFKPDSIRREKIQAVKEEVKEIFDKATFNGGYRGGFGGLGTVTKLLHFKYKNMPQSVQRQLDHMLLHKRPYFTYWLMVVHIIIMILALAIYGFAPYGWDLTEQRSRVRRPDLSFATERKLVVPSVWGGPPQQALVLLGALYAPCMRRDRQLFEEGIEADRQNERDSSGCCVRRDGSGCFQTGGEEDCQERFSDFLFQDNVTGLGVVRRVCGTSPSTCIEPSPANSDGSIWVPTDILTWPICQQDENANSSEPHLRCEVTSRPCCFGIQAICIITTREQCDFLDGRFHQEAFLCSQVSCLDEICGLLPFARFNEPDQFYRLWIALFLHAGLLHLILSLLFSFFILRYIEKRLGWVRTTVIYIVSGIGGNLFSAYFAPYNPGVGPAGSILGVVAYFFVFLIFESPLLKQPWLEFLKLLGVIGGLLVLGLIPYVDNWAHLGGFIFGFFISGVLVPYGDFKEVWLLTNHKQEDFKVYRNIKLLLVFAGIPVLLLLTALFIVLLYVVQSTVSIFSYFTCIPFTSTLCTDQRVFIRDRDGIFIV